MALMADSSMDIRLMGLLMVDITGVVTDIDNEAIVLVDVVTGIVTDVVTDVVTGAVTDIDVLDGVCATVWEAVTAVVDLSTFMTSFTKFMSCCLSFSFFCC